MKDAYDKIKVISDVVNANKLLFIMLFTSLGSVGANIGQVFSGQEKDLEIKASQEQIAVIANHYTAPKTVKTVIVKSGCDKCMKEVKKLWEFH